MWRLRPSFLGGMPKAKPIIWGRWMMGEADLHLLLSGCLGLGTVQIEVAEGAGSYHNVGTLLFGLYEVISGHGVGGLFVHSEDGKAAAFGLA